MFIEQIANTGFSSGGAASATDRCRSSGAKSEQATSVQYGERKRPDAREISYSASIRSLTLPVLHRRGFSPHISINIALLRSGKTFVDTFGWHLVPRQKARRKREVVFFTRSKSPCRVIVSCPASSLAASVLR